MQMIYRVAAATRRFRFTPARVLITTAVLGVLGAPLAHADPRCARIDVGGLEGVSDYRAATDQYRHVVEKAHFTAEYQRQALRGDPKASNGGTWGNLAYTLRRFPNHPRALYMMGLFELQLEKLDAEEWRNLTLQPSYAPFTCYFARASRFAPDDPVVPNSLGILQHRAGKPEDALKSFQKAVELAPQSPEAHYNLGLSQFALEKYAESAASARRAYELGYPKQDLAIKLKRKGHWK